LGVAASSLPNLADLADFHNQNDFDLDSKSFDRLTSTAPSLGKIIRSDDRRPKIKGGEVMIDVLGSSSRLAMVLGIGGVLLAGGALCDTVPQEVGGAVSGAAQVDTIQEIVVTAEKRAEKLSLTPLAVTALTSEALQENHITDPASLAASVPSFNAGMYGGTARLAIRGVGFDSIDPGAEGRVAYYSDGVYYSRPATALSGFFDVDRVEILRGPQGTLYGRNATGGALNVITAEPTEALSGYYTQTMGDYGLFKEEGAISGPLTNSLFGRLAFQVVNRDGYGQNVLTGQDIDNAVTQSVRGKLRYEVTSDLSVTATVDLHHENDRNYGGHYGGQAYPSIFPVEVTTLLSPSNLGAPLPPNVRDTSSTLDSHNFRTFSGVSVTADDQLSFGDVKSITAYRYSDYSDSYPDSTGEAALLTNQERAHQISEELQLSGASDFAKWVTGIYFFHEDISGQVNIPLGVALLNELGIPAPGPSNGYVRGYWAGGSGTTGTEAGYGQGTLNLTPKWELTLGMRVAWERKTVSDANQFDPIDPYIPPNPLGGTPFYNSGSGSIQEFSNTPKVTLAYLFGPDDTAYITAAKGYKSGGFDIGAVQPAFRPETLWDYEVGVKSKMFDGRVQADLAGFYYDYTNLQVSVIKNTVVFTENAASARTYGVEGEIQAILAPRLKLDFSGSYLNATFTNFVTANPDYSGAPVMNYAGYTLPQSPRLHGQLGPEYSVDLAHGTLKFRGDVNYTSRVYFSPFDVSTISQGAYVKEDAGIDYVSEPGNWQVGAYVKNISNKTTVASATANNFLVSDSLLTYLDPPRTFGAYVTVRF
jgi:iron complex outermembrane recepter protein